MLNIRIRIVLTGRIFRFTSSGHFRSRSSRVLSITISTGIQFLPVLVGRNNVPCYHVAGIKGSFRKHRGTGQFLAGIPVSVLMLPVFSLSSIRSLKSFLLGLFRHVHKEFQDFGVVGFQKPSKSLITSYLFSMMSAGMYFSTEGTSISS